MSLNATNLFIQASPLPATFQGGPNEMFTEMIKRMKILSPSGTNFIFIGDTAPTSNVGPWLKNGTQWFVWDPATKTYVPQDISASFTPAFVMGHSRPVTTDPPVWLQTTLDANTSNPTFFGEMLRWFVFDGVNWLSPHPVPPNNPELRMWIGSEAELWSYDGGDGTNPTSSPPTANTGAMWQVETLAQFRFPLGVGTAPNGFDGNIPSAIAVQEQGGDERVVLDEDQIAKHTHLTVKDGGGYGTFGNNLPISRQLNTGVGGTLECAAAGPADAGLTSESDGGKSHQNMPPYFGVYFIKRTTRIYYTPE